MSYPQCELCRREGMVAPATRYAMRGAAHFAACEGHDLPDSDRYQPGDREWYRLAAHQRFMNHESGRSNV